MVPTSKIGFNTSRQVHLGTITLQYNPAARIALLCYDLYLCVYDAQEN